MKIYDIINESTGVTDYNPKSQGGTRKELLAKYHKTKDPKDAAAARKAGATQKELQTVEEGWAKKIKRGLQGWYGDDTGPNGEKLGDPKDVVRRNKSHDDETLQRFAKSIAGEKKTKHSPGELQRRVIDREMKKRGLGEQDVAEGKAVYYHVVDDNNKPIKAFMDSQSAIKFVNDRRQKDPDARKWKVVAKKNAVVGEQGVDEGIFDIFKKLPASGSTVKIAGRPVEITHTGTGGDYIGYTWTDKNGKEHYEETSASNHSNLRSLANTIADEIKAADDDGVDDALDAQIKGRLDRHFGKNKGVAEEYDPSYDPEYRGHQKPEQDPDAWKQERDTADDSESNSIVYIIDTNTDEVVLRFKSTGGYWGDIKHALKHGYDTDYDHYEIKWKRKSVNETATAGATSAGNVAVGAVYKNKPAKQAKNKDGTAKNALDMKANLLTGGSIKR